MADVAGVSDAGVVAVGAVLCKEATGLVGMLGVEAATAGAVFCKEAAGLEVGDTTDVAGVVGVEAATAGDVLSKEAAAGLEVGVDWADVVGMPGIVGRTNAARLGAKGGALGGAF